MKKAQLTVLDIEPLLKWNESFFDDGFVPSIPYMMRLLDEAYCISRPENEYQKTLDKTGACISYQFFGYDIRLHIFYMDLKNETINRITRAHEETHALKELNQLVLLEDRFKTIYGIDLKFNHHDKLSQEIIAEFGKIYFLSREGLDLKIMLDLPSGYNKIIDGEESWINCSETALSIFANAFPKGNKLREYIKSLIRKRKFPNE